MNKPNRTSQRQQQPSQQSAPPPFELHLNVPLGGEQYANMPLSNARAVAQWLQDCLASIDTMAAPTSPDAGATPSEATTPTNEATDDKM